MQSEAEGLLPKCSIGNPERRRLKLKHAWQLTSGFLRIINSRLLTGSTNLIWTMIEDASGNGHA